LILEARVAHVVSLEDAHENDEEKSGEEEDQHHRIEHRKPVNLELVAQHLTLCVVLHSVVELNPGNRRGRKKTKSKIK